MKSERDEDSLLSRWPVFAAALLIAALFGLFSGVVKDVQSPRGIQSADRNGDTPHLSKREPLRAVAAADRKDGSGTHSASDGDAPVPHAIEIAFPRYASAITPGVSAGLKTLPFWPGSRPRAPPARA
ncbi:hypothetical protein ACFFP0_00375 [Rhizobium puerariae]|uniref:Uncharacterized protein n=1 Tax=Rhizobium puerariae TaxID=1585791 RepID=A0ABV6A9I0_9HYPH